MIGTEPFRDQTRERILKTSTAVGDEAEVLDRETSDRVLSVITEH
jgi:hypothetical protein